MAAAETLIVTDSRVHPVKVSKGAPIKWSMVVTGEMTVELSVYFRATGQGSKPVEVPVVNVLHCETASHEWTCPEDGELVFLFDNSFSWFNDKVCLSTCLHGSSAFCPLSTSYVRLRERAPVLRVAHPLTSRPLPLVPQEITLNFSAGGAATAAAAAATSSAAATAPTPVQPAAAPATPPPAAAPGERARTSRLLCWHLPPLVFP
jgi:hypothetical protein